MYYLITNIGTYDCSVQEFTDINTVLKEYEEYITSGIKAELAQKLNITICLTPTRLDPAILRQFSDEQIHSEECRRRYVSVES